MTGIEGYIELEDEDPTPLEAALSPDDTDHIHTSVDDKTLRIEFTYSDVSTALNSLDDALSCLSTAKEITKCV